MNALGQRIVKSFGGVTTVFHYDQNGRLIAESGADGLVRREYIYLHDQPASILTTTYTVDQAINETAAKKFGDWAPGTNPDAYLTDYLRHDGL